jgi:MoxR-like ATPase
VTAPDLRELEAWLDRQVIGQQHLIQRLLIALLADGHLLVEGAPGLAKTRAIKSLGDALEGTFHRIQFTPDLLPGDVTGTEIYRPQQGQLPLPAGPGVQQPGAGGRDQPRSGQGPVGAAGGHGRAAGERRQRQPTRCRACSSSWRRRTPSSRKAPIRCPRRSSTASCCMCASTTRTPRPSGEILRLTRSARPRTAATPPPPVAHAAGECVRGATATALDMHMADAVEEYIVQLVGAPAETPPPTARISRAGSNTAAAPGPRLPSTAVPAPTRWLRGRRVRDAG